MRKATSSKLQTLMTCAASGALPAVIGEVGEPAEDGTDIHGFLYHMAKGDGFGTSIQAVANARTPARQRVLQVIKAKDLANRCASIDIEPLRRYWGALDYRGELAIVYNAFSGKAQVLGENIGRAYPDENPGDIFMTLDVSSSVHCLDYKTGRHRQAPALENWQVRLGALGVRGIYGTTAPIEMGLAYLQEDGSWEFDTVMVGGMELDGWADDLKGMWSRLAEAREEVRAGRTPDVYPTQEGCQYCPCVPACPAHTALVRHMDAEVLNVKAATDASLTLETLGQAWVRLQAVKKVVERMEEGLKTVAAQEPIPLPSGKVLRVTQEPREFIDGAIALRVLEEAYGAGVASQCCPPGATKKSLRALGDRADEALELIRRAGGVSVKYYATPREVKP